MSLINPSTKWSNQNETRSLIKSDNTSTRINENFHIQNINGKILKY